MTERPRIEQLSEAGFSAMIATTRADQKMLGHYQHSVFDPFQLATAHVRAMATERVLERLDNVSQKEAIETAGINAREDARVASAWKTNFKDMSA